MPAWVNRLWSCLVCGKHWQLAQIHLVAGRLDTIDAGIRLITRLLPMRIDDLAARLGESSEQIRRRVRGMSDRVLFDSKCYPLPGPSGRQRYERGTRGDNAQVH